MRLLSRLTMLICLGFAVPAYAQFDTASVVGTVHDSSSAATPDTTVTLTNAETGVSLTRTTNGEGVYEFTTVRPGVYVVTAEKPGFALALVDGVQVQVGARQRIDLQMAVGAVTEKLEVTAAAPLVETETSQRGQVISETTIRELPLNGQRARTEFLDRRFLALQAGGAGRSGTSAVPARGVQPVQPCELHGAKRQPQHGGVRHDYFDV